MLYKIFIGFVAVICAFLIYDAGNVAWHKYDAGRPDPAYVIAGDNADLTIVEFLNYTCSYCRDLHPVLMRALERDGRVRYVIRPISSLQSKQGTDSAVLAYAAGRQGQFLAAHNILIENLSPIDDLFIRNLASQLGIDFEALKADFENPDIQALPEKNLNYLKAFSVDKVPTLLVGDEVLMRMTSQIPPSSDDLVALFNRVRTL